MRNNNNLLLTYNILFLDQFLVSEFIIINHSLIHLDYFLLIKGISLFFFKQIKSKLMIIMVEGF